MEQQVKSTSASCTKECGGTNRCYTFRRIHTSTIRFQVKVRHDVAVCLSTDDKEMPDDMYEIFIGCWGGSESGIRRQKHEDVCRIKTPNIVSDKEFHSFWIKIKQGVLKVGKSGEKQPFMTYSDPHTLLHVTWYGYSLGCIGGGEWNFPDEEEEGLSPAVSDTASSDSEGEDMEKLTGKVCHYERTAKWIPVKGGYIPPNAVSGGSHHTGEVHVGMACHGDGHILGMVVAEHGCCYIPFGGKAIPKSEYFVLTNPERAALTWASGAKGKVPSGALQGGISEDGEHLYIGRVHVDGEVSIGKVHPSHEVCYVPYEGNEYSHKNYEVLCAHSIACKMPKKS